MYSNVNIAGGSLGHVTESADAIARRLAAIVESSDDAIVSKDLNGIVLSWNQAAERMFGYTAAEMIGSSIRLIIPDERQSEEDTVLASIRAGRARRALRDRPKGAVTAGLYPSR